MLSVVNMLPQQRQTIARLTVSALVASLPLLYVSLLRPPPAALAGDTAFWFLMSNCVVAAIVAADDAGTLFFSPKADDPCDDDGGGDGRSYVVVSGEHMVAAAAVDGSCGAVVPVAATHDEPTAVDTWGGRVRQEEVASMTTCSNPVDRTLLPCLIKWEEENDDDAAAIKPGTGMNHASVLHRAEEDEVVIKPSSTDTNNALIMENQEEEEVKGELAIVKQEDGASAEPEPEPEPRPRLVASKRLVEEEEADDDEELRFCRTGDVLQDASAGAARGGKLRRWATEGSKPTAEESEYWELSDEELNRRVEDFIARFNREMRLQVEQEAAV
ncbi:hypothetical protein ACP70R_024797 [Stipagrostis hirtigluma subsp. patula]